MADKNRLMLGAGVLTLAVAGFFLLKPKEQEVLPQFGGDGGGFWWTPEQQQNTNDGFSFDLVPNDNGFFTQPKPNAFPFVINELGQIAYFNQDGSGFIFDKATLQPIASTNRSVFTSAKLQNTGVGSNTARILNNPFQTGMSTELGAVAVPISSTGHNLAQSNHTSTSTSSGGRNSSSVASQPTAKELAERRSIANPLQRLMSPSLPSVFRRF